MTAADPYDVDVPRLVVDTMAPLEQTAEKVLQWLDCERLSVIRAS